MESSKASKEPRLRRSHRVSLAMPVVVTSLDGNVQFSEKCETIMMNAHGASLRSPRAMDPGTAVRLEIHQGRDSTTGRVAMCLPAGKLGKLWEVAVELDSPGNFWGIHFPPKDWNIGGSASADKSQVSSTPAEPSAPPRAAEPARIPPPAPADFPVPGSARIVPEPEPAGPTGSPAAPARQAEASSAWPLQPAPPSGPGGGIASFQETLREKARAILAELEGDYRQSLGDLVPRLRAELQQQASADLERLRKQARESLEEMARGTLEKLDKVRDQMEARLGNLDEVLQKKTAPLADQLAVQIRKELQAWATGLREQAKQEWKQFGETQAAVQAQLEEVRRTRDYVVSLARSLSDTIDQRVQDSLSSTLERLEGHWEQEFQQRLAKTCERLDAIRSETEKSVETALNGQRAELLGQFQQEADKLARSMIVQWHATLRETLQSISSILQDKLSH